MIQAIETRYKGYRFRSRLEARWAVFFDTLGIAWEYEKEGYDLGEAGWYLPDFWLPNLKCWVEIKPDTLGHGILHDDYWPLMYAFSEQAEAQIIVCIGIPGESGFALFDSGHVSRLGMQFPLNIGNTDRANAAARSARFEHGEQP